MRETTGEIQPFLTPSNLSSLLERPALNHRQPFSRELLKIDSAQTTGQICAFIRREVRRFRRKGLVVGLSGGIDSSTVAALAVRALGRERVFGLHMPERDSSPDTVRLSRLVAEHLGIASAHEEISPLLEAAGCYRRRDEAIRQVIPEYGPGWKSKLALPSVTDGESFRIFSIVAQDPTGLETALPLPLEVNLAIVAATNFKQRTRKMLEYFHADRLNYAVGGTPNRLECELGFFVKQGDGAADLKPIAHLYKTQVYDLAKHLGVPAEIAERPPTTDTYSLSQTQEEFYFSLPYGTMDLVLYGQHHEYSPAEIAPSAGLTAEQVARVFLDLEAKRRVAAYLRAAPAILDEPGEPPRSTGV